MNKNKPMKALFIDGGKEDALSGIRSALTMKGIGCESFENPGEAMHALVLDAFDVVILNLKAFEVNWVDIHKEIRTLDPAVYVILFSEDALLPENAAEAAKHDRCTFMIQSSDEEELMKTLSIIEQKTANSKEKAEDLDRLSLNIQNLEEILKLFKTLLKK